MQKIITILLITLFALSFNSQSIEELEEMAMLFARSAEMTSYDDYYRYVESRKGESIIRFINKNRNRNETVLIIAEEDIYGSCQERIDRYILDIGENLIYSTVFYTVTRAVSPQDIKDLISNYYDQYSIEGAVLIGDVSTAWFEIANDFNQYGYVTFPIDLYYMDMDGVWQDTNNNGRYDSHSGDRNPEIFIGRINTAPMIGIASEEEMLNNYLDRNHDYWQGNIIASNKTGLSYTDYDWISFSYFFHDISNIWGSDNYEYYYYGDGTFSRTDYLNRVGQNIYGMIQFACHSSWSRHFLENEPVIDTHQIYSIPPDALSYNLFNCSGCRWTSPTSSDSGYLGGVYVYNYGSNALFAIGSTKTGSMLGFSHYYIPLGNGETNGEAFKQWWINYIGSNPSFTEMCWFYGMTIVGDPMVRLVYDSPAEFELSPSEHEFNDTPVGSCSSVFTFTLENIGASTATGDIEISFGVNYEITSGGGNFTLGPGQTRSIGVRFCPDSEGLKLDAINVRSLHGGVYSILRGRGIAADDISLAEALNNNSLEWETYGDGFWFGQSDTYYYGGSSAQSGEIDDNESSTLSTVVTGPGELKFYWKVSSENGFDWLNFYLNDNSLDRISGDVDWHEKIYQIPEGNHTVKWVYEKDSSISSNQDTGWVDYVRYTPAIDPDPAEFVLSPSTHDFGYITVGSCSSAFTFTLENIGGSSGSGYIELYFKEAFEITSGGGSFTLGPGQIRSINVRFCPDSEESLDDYLDILPEPGGDYIIYSRVYGIGFIDDPDPAEFELSPSSYDFGDIPVGSCSSVFTFTLENTGGSSSSGYIDIAAGYNFEIISGGGSFILGAGQIRSISVRFCPDSEGQKVDGLDVRDSQDGDLIIGSTLHGNGTPVNGISLAEALNNSSLEWETYGDGLWFGQSDTYYYGGSSAQSGEIDDNESSTLSTVVTGPGELKFYWKVSSENNFDWLNFYLNDNRLDRISGDDDWHEKTYQIPEGNHTVKWIYEKDSSISSNEDTAWVDYVRFTPDDDPDPAEFDLSPSSYNFGSVNLGSCSSVHTFMLSNTGGSSGSGYISIRNGSHFEIISGGGNFTLGPGFIRNIHVRFCPDLEGPLSDHLDIRESAGGSLITSSILEGTGIGPDPDPAEFVLSPSSHNFGSVNVGSCSSVHTFTLSNTGGSSGSGHISFLTGTHFEITSGGGSFALNAGQTRNISVKFCPTSTGSKTDYIDVRNSAGGSLYTYSHIYGEGTADDDSSLTAVFRFFNTVRGGHLYTVSEIERDYILDNLPEWVYEGISFKVYLEETAGTVPSYRFFNTNTGIHLYTTSDHERDHIIDNYPEWNYEGISFYVYPTSIGDTIPVFRFFNTLLGGHLYTISDHERDHIIDNLPEWNYEGISFYVYPYVEDFPPDAPSNLQASAVSQSHINLNWTRNSHNEQGFKIERKTGAGGSWSEIATLGANITSYNNTGLSPNTTYYYRVRAYNSAGNSGYSNEAHATTYFGDTSSSVPKTGQTIEYRYGDDGHYQMGVAWPTPRFTDNGNGTLTDNLTGLMWTKDANMGGTKNWNDAIDWCNNLVHGGHSDWRLPNVRELHSLIDKSEYNPALQSVHSFTNIMSNMYWSSTTYAGNTGSAWRVSPGSLGSTWHESKGNSRYVWAVRGTSNGEIQVHRTGQTISYREGDDGDHQMGAEWPEPRFTDNGDGTVTDNLTGLMWTKNVNMDGTKNWNNAIDYCNNLAHAGHDNWRLPNIRELQSIVDYSKDNPPMSDGHPFSGIVSSAYWSSSTYANLTDRAWFVDMLGGGVYVSTKATMNYVWPVRAGH